MYTHIPPHVRTYIRLQLQGDFDNQLQGDLGESDDEGGADGDGSEEECEVSGRRGRRARPVSVQVPGPLRPCTWLPVDCWLAHRMRAKACSQSEGIGLHMQPPDPATRRACAGCR